MQRGLADFTLLRTLKQKMQPSLSHITTQSTPDHFFSVIADE